VNEGVRNGLEGEFKESSCGELNRENLEPKRVGKISKGMILSGRVASPRLPQSAEGSAVEAYEYKIRAAKRLLGVGIKVRRHYPYVVLKASIRA